MKKYFVTLTVLAIVGVGFYQKIYIPKHTFETINSTNGDMSIRVNGVGNVAAKDIYKIGTIYGGKVSEFYVNDGDFIKRKDLIAKIDSIDLGYKIVELDSAIKKLKNDAESLKIDKQSAEAQYEYQNELFKRNRELFHKHTISELDFEKFKKDTIVAKLKVESLASKIDSLYNQIGQTDASLKGLKERLSRYTISSPVDGYITKRLISNHAIINPNQTLLEIVNPQDVWIATHIDTRISGEVKIGDSATIKLRSSNKKYIGKVSNIKPINNSVTNEREIDVSFDNLPIPFYLEEQAIVDIDIKNLKNIIKVPTKALTIYKEKEGVWIVDNNIIHFKPIKVLAYSKSSVATKDITITDRLVIPNPKKKSLNDGMKIYYD